MMKDLGIKDIDIEVHSVKNMCKMWPMLSTPLYIM